MKKHVPTWRICGIFAALGVVALVSPGINCVSVVVTGAVAPANFQHADVEMDEPTRRGEHYWVACLRARLDNGSTSASYVCSVGIQVPHGSSKGSISLAHAQSISARRANEAAQEVFRRVDFSAPVSDACSDFRDEFRYRLRLDVPEATVKDVCHLLASPTLF